MQGESDGRHVLAYGRAGGTAGARIWMVVRYLAWVGAAVCFVIAVYAFKLSVAPEDVLPRGGWAFVAGLACVVAGMILLLAGHLCWRRRYPRL